MPTFKTPDGLTAAVESLALGALLELDEPDGLVLALLEEPLSQAAIPVTVSALAIVVATARLIRMHSPCVVCYSITNIEKRGAISWRETI
jgi:hypothetical protein